MYPVLFKIGPITIYTYGFFVFLGVLFSYLICKKRAGEVGIDKKVFSNIFFWALISGFIGARLVYLITKWQYFIEEPLSLILNRSGFVFYGGVIFGLVALVFFAKRYKIKFLKITDLLALGAPLGHALGRIGCFFYGCCYGIITESFLGIQFPNSSPAGLEGVKVVPTQLISSGFLFILFLFLFTVRKKIRGIGRLTGYYLFFYALFRFIIELFRGDPRGFFLILSTSQWISILVIFFAIIILGKKQGR